MSLNESKEASKHGWEKAVVGRRRSDDGFHYTTAIHSHLAIIIQVFSMVATEVQSLTLSRCPRCWTGS